MGTDARLARVTEVVGVTRVVGATVGVTVTTSAAKGLVLVGVATTPGTAGFEGTTTAAPPVLLLLSSFTTSRGPIHPPSDI